LHDIDASDVLKGLRREGLLSVSEGEPRQVIAAHSQSVWDRQPVVNWNESSLGYLPLALVRFRSLQPASEQSGVTDYTGVRGDICTILATSIPARTAHQAGLVCKSFVCLVMEPA